LRGDERVEEIAARRNGEKRRREMNDLLQKLNKTGVRYCLEIHCNFKRALPTVTIHANVLL
jgi:hypothetical protein